MGKTTRKRRKRKYCGIGGQAVLEGIMMRNKDDYAVAVRKPDGEMAVEVKEYKGILPGSPLKKIPFVRGSFNFIDSMVLGMTSLSISAEYFAEEEEDKDKKNRSKKQSGRKPPVEPGTEMGNVTYNKAETAPILDNLEEAGYDRPQDTPAEGALANTAKDKKDKSAGDSIFVGVTMVISMIFAIGLFMVLPYFIAQFLMRFIRNESLLSLVEGVIRILMFLTYVLAISGMKDIYRLYQYHGAEHKCINCVERGLPLTVDNVMKCSRLHRRCGTSFILFVMFVSVVLFFFIRIPNPLLRVVIRLALVPVIAGISYELIRLAGKTDFFLVNLLSAPGMGLQKITTKEPDKEMVEIAIAAVESVFDWREYLRESFDMEV